MSKRIVIEMHPSKCVRTFHVSALISPIRIFAYSMGDKEDLLSGYPHLLNLYESLRDIDGVTGVALDKYEIKIYIGKAFDWQEIEEEVLRQIMDLHGWMEEEVDVQLQGLFL